MAGDLLRAGLRLTDAGLRQAGRPVRPSPDLSLRPAAVGVRLRRRRDGADLAALPLGTGGAGDRHGAGALLRTGAGDLGLSARAAAPGARRLLDGDAAGVGGRAAAG